MKHFSISSKWIPIGIGLLLTLITAYLLVSPPPVFRNVLQQLNNATYDARQTISLPKIAKPEYPIAIVDIDEKSLKAEGRWPWPRDKVAQLLSELYAQGATVVAFDMLFPEPEQNIASRMLSYLEKSQLATPGIQKSITDVTPYFDNDALFAKIIASGNNKVVLGTFFDNANYQPVGLLPAPLMELSSTQANDLVLAPMKTYIANIPILENAAGHAGFMSIIPDSDGIIRHYSLVMRYQNNMYPSLALEAVRLYLLLNSTPLEISKLGNHDVIESIKLGKEPIATDIDGRVFIPYIGRAKSFPYFSATDVLNKNIKANSLQNTLVFVGTSAIGLNDIRSTSIAGVYPGVEIHANIAEGLFRGHFPYVPVWAPGAELVFIILIGILLSIVFVYVGPLWNLFITLVSFAGLFLGSAWLWKTTGIILPIVLPLMQIFLLAIFNMIYGFFAETRKRFELRRVFTQYVPPGHVDEILKHPDDIAGLSGERKLMTVLFMDIRHFTTISEKLSIVELKKLLNFFFTEMTKIIFKHGGTVDKYVGDMIMAFWGAPLDDKSHAQHALAAALDMQAVTEKLQAQLKNMNLPEVHIGVGINTGMMDVGDMGSSYRRAYTVLGDAVNLASRLESLTKYYGVGIIVGEQTFELNKASVTFRELDRVQVKGKASSVTIYTPSNESPETIKLYHDALYAYYQQDWLTAKKLFTTLNQPLFLERITYFMQNPPSKDWNGVWVLQEK